MKKSNVFWLLSLVFLISTIIDLADAYMPKLLSSVFLTIGFVMLALGQSAKNKTGLNRAALFCFLVSLAAVVYRLVLYFKAS